MSTKIKSCIEFNNFKNDPSLYTVESLKKTLKKNVGKIGTGNKAVLFEKVKKIMLQQLSLNYPNINDIIKIQSLIRMANVKHQIKLCGPGFLNRNNINNDCDFLTCLSHKETPIEYFFSYKDNDSFIYFFDIRSFKKLINNNAKNPYNRQDIPRYIIYRMSKKINYLKRHNISLSLDEDPLPDKETPEGINIMINDIFIEISNQGYDIQQKWFLELNIYNLKKLYMNLEDIWNYRSELSILDKRRIVPPNGMVFIINSSNINSYNDRFHLIKIIINDVYKLIMTGQNIEDRKIGMMYFLIALGEVSSHCMIANPWISFLNTV